MKPRCPYYKQQSVKDPATDKIYEGIVWCDLSDHPCMLEYDGECEEYEEQLKEEDA